eukprot:3441420-Rhodomonas_salina.1
MPAASVAVEGGPSRARKRPADARQTGDSGRPSRDAGRQPGRDPLPPNIRWTRSHRLNHSVR